MIRRHFQFLKKAFFCILIFKNLFQVNHIILFRNRKIVPVVFSGVIHFVIVLLKIGLVIIIESKHSCAYLVIDIAIELCGRIEIVMSTSRGNNDVSESSVAKPLIKRILIKSGFFRRNSRFFSRI